MKKTLPIILFTLAFVNSMFSQLPGSPTLATANVPEASQYGVLYQLDIGTSGTYSSMNTVGYTVDNSALTLNYSRVAYFLQLDNKWVWVSMNDFSTNNAQLGIPYSTSGVVWQQTVSAMNVYGSTNSGITATVNATGNIEMWSNCYNTGNGLANIGGNASTYDFNDTYTNFNCYGSFQIHNFGAQQTVFAFNAFASNSNYDLGIGNNTVVANGNPDWTYMANAGTYTTKKLWILINNVYITTQPSVGSATACIGGTATPISITAGVNSGTITSYQWYSNTLNSNTGGTLVATNTTSSTTNTFTPSTTNAGTLYYYCVVNGTNGSFFKSEVSGARVTANPMVTISGAATICSGDTISLGASAAGAAGTYTWSTGANTTSITVNPTSATVYSVSFTNAGGCIGTNSVTINTTALPVLSIAGPTAICAGQTANLSGSGATTYTWSTNSNATSINASPTSNTTYTLSGTSSGCTGSTTAILNVNPNPVITVNNGTICAGESFNIIPGGASTYTVQGGSTNVNPSSNATYTVMGASAAGCISASSATSSVTVNASPTITVNSGSICAGQSFNILPSGATTYTVQGGTTSVSPTANTSYTVTGTNLAGCVSQNFATSSVTVNSLPTLAISGTPTLCAGSSVSLSANGATTYTWSTAANTATINVSPATNTTYSLTGTSLAGCNGNTATLAVTVNTVPVIALSGTNVLCAGSSVTLSATGANTYTWSTGSNATSIIENPALTSTYTVIGISAEGCAGNTASLVLTVNPNPTLTITGATGICTGQNASLTANGAPTYSWSTGSTSSSIVTTPTSNTTYTVTGTSPFGCTTTTIQAVTVQASLSISVAGPTAVCNGQNANLTGLGGVTYTWNTGATTATIAPTMSTTTTFTVLGASGTCSNTAIFTVAVNANPTLALTGNTAICNGSTTTLTASGATNYSWTSGSNNAAAALSPTTSTTYSVSGSFTTGCADTLTVAVTVYSLPVIAITGSNVICTGDTTVLNVSGAATYTWNTAANTTSISVNPTTTDTYTAAGTSTDGCISFAVSTVTVNALPIMTLTGNSAICAGASQTLSIAGANSYTWSTSANGNSVVVTPTITSGVVNFSVAGTSTAGCKSFLTDSLVVNAIPSLTIAGGSYVCNGNTLTLNASGASTYSWNTGATTNSLAVTPSVNTSYSVVGTSTAGCSGMAVNDITVVALPSVLIAGDSVICSGDSLTLVASGANTYTWSTGATSSLVVVKPLANTTYSLVGEIGAGCSDTTQTSITVNSLPSLSLTVASNTICLGEQTIISIDGASTYTWNTASNSNSISVSPSLTTMYSVAGTGTNNCVSRDSLSLVVSECLSITKQNIAALTRVYPNPTAGVFVIETPATNAAIRIVNVFGQTVLTATTTGKTTVNLADYSKGIYFVYILQDNNIVYKNAVIKD